MKSLVKLFGTNSLSLFAIALIAVIGFAFVGCDNPAGGGGDGPSQGEASTVTITGLSGVPSGNYYLIGNVTINDNEEGKIDLICAQSFSGNNIQTVKARNGSVTFTVYKVSGEKYTGAGIIPLSWFDIQVVDISSGKLGEYYEWLAMFESTKAITFPGNGEAITIDFSDFE